MIRLARYLRPPQIKLELATTMPEEAPEGWSRERLVWSVKERVLLELVPLLEASGRVVNTTKLLTDLINREKKASTGIGNGIAIPHVRTMQARDFAVCVARSSAGVEFDASDGAPVHIFFGVVTPPYDDKLYLEFYKEIGALLVQEAAREALMNAKTPHELIKAIIDATG